MDLAVTVFYPIPVSERAILTCQRYCLLSITGQNFSRFTYIVLEIQAQRTDIALDVKRISVIIYKVLQLFLTFLVGYKNHNSCCREEVVVER